MCSLKNSVHSRPDDDHALIHISSPHWTEKFDNNPLKSAPVRFLTGPHELNCDCTKFAAIERYGKVENPLISEIIGSWVTYARQHKVRLKECRITKDDINGAFTQFDLSPESTMLMGINDISSLSMMSENLKNLI